MRTPQLAPILLALLAIACSLPSHHAVLASNDVQDRAPLLYCRDGNGLCFWNGRRWRQTWTSSAPNRVCDFQRLKNATVIFDRGHGEAGRIIVELDDGTMSLRHEFDEAGGCDLSMCAGWSASGEIILCNGDSAYYRCNTWLDLKALGGDREFLEFPRNCVYPRFLADGSLVCLRTRPQISILMEVSSGQGRFDEIFLELDSKSVESFEILHRNLALIVAGESLFLWDGASIRALAGRGVSRLGRIGDRLYWVRCEASEEIPFSACRVETLSAKNAVRTVWGPRDAFPESIVPSSDGHLVVDAWAETERQIWLLEISPQEVLESLVFSDPLLGE